MVGFVGNRSRVLSAPLDAQLLRALEQSGCGSLHHRERGPQVVRNRAKKRVAKTLVLHLDLSALSLGCEVGSLDGEGDLVEERAKKLAFVGLRRRQSLVLSSDEEAEEIVRR